MKKIFKSLVTGVLVAGMTAATMFTSAVADQTSEKSVTVSVEKFTIGQGYVCQPVTVELNEGDKGLDVLKRAVGDDKVIMTSSDWGSYISGFKDKDTGDVKLADIYSGVLSQDSLTKRASSDVLSEFDYTSEAGFMFFVNGQSAMEGIDSYTPQDGDVLRICFTIYNYGADIGIDNSSWGGSASLIGNISRESLTKAIAKANACSVDANDAISVISNLDSTQAQLDDAEKALLEKIEKANEKPDDNKDNNENNENKDNDTKVDNSTSDKNDNVEKPSNDDKTPSTGVAVSLVLPAVLGAGMIFTKKRK